jgi:hypothetical protein
MPISLLERHSSAAWFDEKVPPVLGVNALRSLGAGITAGAGSLTDGDGAGLVSGILSTGADGEEGDGAGGGVCANAAAAPTARAAGMQIADSNLDFI